MKYLPQKGIFAGFTINIIIVLLLGWVSLKRMHNENQLENIRQHDDEVLLNLEKAQSNIYRLQNLAKSYLLSQNEAYSEQFRARSFEVERALQSLEILFSADPEQRRNLAVLSKLADNKIKRHSRMMELATYKSFEEARKSFDDNENLQTNDELDRQLFKIAGIEDSKYQSIKIHSVQSETWYKAIFVICYVCAVLLLFIVLFIIRHYLKERRKVESLLQGNRQLLQSIIDNTSNPVFVKELSGRYILANTRFQSLFSDKHGIITGKSDTDIFPPEVAEKMRSDDLDVVKAEKELRFEQTLPQQGETRTYIIVKFPIRNSENQIYAIGGIAIDITEQKKSETQLMENESLIQNIFESAPEAVVMINEKSEVMKWNKRCELLFGWPASEVLGKPIYDFIIPERYREEHKRGMKRFLETGVGPILNRTIEVSSVNRDGQELEIEMSISASQMKGKNVFIAFVKDIRQRKNLAKENKRTNDFLDSIIENIPDMVFVKDAKELRFVRLNKAGEELLGISRDELLGKDDFDFFPKDQAEFFISTDRKTLESGGVQDIPEEMIDTKSGKRWLHTKKITIHDENGKPVYLLGISEDITNRKSLEDERDLAEKELKESENRLELILENIGEGVVVSDASQRVLLYNQMAGEILKPKNLENFVNWSAQFNIYFPDGKSVFPAQNLPIIRALRGEAVSELELMFEDPATRRRKRVVVSGHPIRNQNNKIIAAVTTLRDVTRLKEMERALKETELKYRNLIGFRRDKSEAGTTDENNKEE
jgi:PAS domain S-box-containing protein